MHSPRIAYTPRRDDATPEGELDVLASVYSFVLSAHRDKQEGGSPTAPDDAMKGSKDDRAGRIIPERP